MAKGPFSSTINCEFIITSESVLPEEITSYLGISPHRSFKRGDTHRSKYSGSLITRPHHLWAVMSKATISEEQDIKPHMLYIKPLLHDKIDLLSKLKDDARLETSFWLWFRTEEAGIGIDLFETEMVIMNKIAKRLHISVITGSECKNEVDA
jgi:hypothetical protein